MVFMEFIKIILTVSCLSPNVFNLQTIMINVLFSFCSTTVFGVSTDSMQVSYDSRGNSVPTILLLLQHHLYRQGGLQVFQSFFTLFIHKTRTKTLICHKVCAFINLFNITTHFQAEGIFRISADNGQEEHLRSQLNRGVVPDGVDVHCLASLIKV